ncbi:unnamed protein product [Alopecurus aequalis]
MDARHQSDEMPPLKRPKNEQETPTEGETDRLSSLPDGLLQHLLSFMPAHDAVRTCLLARRWRHLWKSAPAIHFTNGKWLRSANRFNQFVDRVLRIRRKGAPLESCDFQLEETELYSNEFVEANEQHLSSWIRRALCRKVRVLRFRLGFDVKVSLPNMPLVSHHLTTLELHCVNTNESVLNFSGCPALVDLIMMVCTINSEKMSSSSLKHLKMMCIVFDDPHRTRMSLPNLVSLELDNVSGRVPLLESMPSLATAIVGIVCEPSNRCKMGGSADCGDDACEGCRYYYGSDDDRRHCVILGSLSQATNLELSAYPEMFVFKRDLNWAPTFNKLKTLVLNEWFVTDDFGALIWFLQHSPLLEKLSLQITKEHKVSKEIAGRYGPVEQSVASDYLELVEIKCQDVDEMVVAVLKILYVSGIPLEKIHIHKYSRLGWIKFACMGFSPNGAFGSPQLWI